MEPHGSARDLTISLCHLPLLLVVHAHYHTTGIMASSDNPCIGWWSCMHSLLLKINNSATDGMKKGGMDDCGLHEHLYKVKTSSTLQTVVHNAWHQDYQQDFQQVWAEQSPETGYWIIQHNSSIFSIKHL